METAPLITYQIYLMKSVNIYCAEYHTNWICWQRKLKNSECSLEKLKRDGDRTIIIFFMHF